LEYRLSQSQNYEELFTRFDQEVEEAIEEAYRAEGYVDADGQRSDTAMKDAAFKIAMDRCVVGSKAERSKKSLTGGGYYSLVFPSGPGAGEEVPDLDRVSEAVLKKLKSDVWGLTQTRRSGFLQLRLEGEESTLVVCRCRVYRLAEGAPAFYMTDNENLIMEDAVDKEIQSLVRRASSLRRDLSMIIERHPKLQGQVAGQLESELVRIDRELTIGPPSDGGRKKLGAGAKG